MYILEIDPPIDKHPEEDITMMPACNVCLIIGISYIHWSKHICLSLKYYSLKLLFQSFTLGGRFLLFRQHKLISLLKAQQFNEGKQNIVRQ